MSVVYEVPVLQYAGRGSVLPEWVDLGLPADPAEGGALFAAGAAASVSEAVDVGDLIKDENRWRFPGMHGSFNEDLGVRGRIIAWHGVLRVSQSALAAIMQQRDRLRSLSGRFLFYDADGTLYDNCRLVSFVIATAQRERIEDAVLDWLVPFELVLDQLEP